MFTYTQNLELLNTPSLDDVVQMFLTPSFDLDRETAFEKINPFLPVEEMIVLAREYRVTGLRKGEFCRLKAKELEAVGIIRAPGTIQNVLQAFVRSIEATE